jgi:putative transposase
MERMSRITLAILLTEGNFSCVKAAQGIGLFSHDQLTRELAKEVAYTAILTPLEDLPKEGELSTDDTVIAKPHATEIEGLEYTYSSSDDKVVFGMSVFLGTWRAGGKLYLVKVELPGECSKHELFQELLRQLKEAGCEPSCVYFDSWYACSATLNLIDGLQWTYVTRIKSNRLYEGIPLKKLRFFGAKSKQGRLKGVKHRVQIVKHGDRFLATNVLTPHNTRSLVRQYQKRWVIETVFRALKSVLHLEKCSCRSQRAQFNHLLAAIEAFKYLVQAFPDLGPELAQREFIRQYRAGLIKPQEILRHAA